MSDDPMRSDAEVQDPTLPIRRVRVSQPSDAFLQPTQPRVAVRPARLSPTPQASSLDARVTPPRTDASGLAGWHWGRWLALLGALIVLFVPSRPGADVYLSSAAQARQVYRYDMALALYAQAHTASPGDPRPLCASGDVYTLQQLPALAGSAYHACAALAPNDGSAWLRLGDALETTQDDAGAVSAWTRAAGSGDFAGYARLAARAEGMGQLADAARWWSQAPQDDEQAQGRLGLIALAQGDVGAARAHLFPLLRSKSPFARQLQHAGIFLLDLRAPTSATDEVNIGYALLTLGEPGVALTPLQRAARLDPTDGSARAYYGYTLWSLGQTSAARPEIAAGVRYSPTLPFALYAAGQVAMADHQFARALADVQTALEVDTKNPALWSAAGDAALRQRDYLTAEQSYRNAAQFSDDPAYTIQLVQYYLDTGVSTESGSVSQAAFAGARRFPTNEPLTFLEAQADETYGQADDAYFLYQRAIALDPTDPRPWLALGRFAAVSGEVVPAIVDLHTALALRPQGPEAAEARHLLARVDAGSL